MFSALSLMATFCVSSGSTEQTGEQRDEGRADRALIGLSHTDLAGGHDLRGRKENEKEAKLRLLMNFEICFIVIKGLAPQQYCHGAVLTPFRGQKAGGWKTPATQIDRVSMNFNRRMGKCFLALFSRGIGLLKRKL